MQLFIALLSTKSLVLTTMAAALQASELRFRGIFEHAGIGMVVVRPDGLIGEANPAFQYMVGRSGAQLKGRTLADVTYPGDWALDPPVVKGLLDGQSPPYHVIKRYLHEDGSVVWAKVTATQVPDGSPGPGYAIGLIEDITAQRTTQESLAREEEELRRTTHMLQTLIDAAPMAILTLGLEGRVQLWNRAATEIFGWTEAEVIGRAPPFLPPEAQQEFRKSLARLRAGEALTGLQVARLRRDGMLLHVRVCAAPTHTPDGMVDGAVALLEDVTERKSLGEQLREAQKMEAVGQLTAGIAHDFNNILTVVITNIAMLADQITPAQREMREEVVEVQRAALRGAELVRKLMAFSRQRPLELGPVNLATVLRDIERALGHLVPGSIEVTAQVDAEDSFLIEGDVGSIEQILFNLATNARDAMPEGGTFRLSLYRAWLDEEHRLSHGWGSNGEYVVLAASDTGCGMSPQVRARVFDPFFTTKAPGKGTGLGMAMVFGLMKQHKGYIALETEEGRGTTFRLYFPAVISPDGASSPALSSLPLAGGTERILVVDDEDGIRRPATRVLSRAGYKVEHAAGGEEALALLAAPGAEFDLIITDLVMPRMGGLALYQELQHRGGCLRVLLMSGHPPEDFESLKANEPGLRFLNKPWSVTDLLRRVRDVLDEKRS
jgi:PAS domain S-box-containing protein